MKREIRLKVFIKTIDYSLPMLQILEMIIFKNNWRFTTEKEYKIKDGIRKLVVLRNS